MVTFRIEALLRRFDTKFDTRVTGSLSALLGEALLLETLCHALTAAGHTVTQLEARPTRDDAAFGPRCEKPKVRDLDAWLLLDGTDLVAVECKHWTAASYDGATVPDDPTELATYARREWARLVAHSLDVEEWTKDNKVFLPLQPPSGVEPVIAAGAMARLRRILAIWRPVSADGMACLSPARSTTVVDDVVVPASGEVFSASLYLRSLLATGVTHLSAQLRTTQRLLDAVDALFEDRPPGP